MSEAATSPALVIAPQIQPSFDIPFYQRVQYLTSKQNFIDLISGILHIFFTRKNLRGEFLP